MQKVLVTGTSGFVGSALCRYLSDKGYNVIRIVRKKSSNMGSKIFWDPNQGFLEHTDLEGAEIVIHLAGKNVASGRWSQKLKKEIQQSRVESTRLLAQTLLKVSPPPKVFLCASGTGFYGTNGDKKYTEKDSQGQGFLAETCVKWESETLPLESIGIRVIRTRFGLVLGKTGGALSMMLPFFRLGLGGVIGSGKQFISWISIEDVLLIIDYLLQNQKIKGPVNVVTPFPITNREFTKILGRIIKRPTMFKVPEFVIRGALGEMGDQMLLSSSQVLPQKLLDNGYTFKFPHLDAALSALLRREN